MDRFVSSLTGQDRPPSSDDPRFAGYLVRERVAGYQIGYSVVAEAYLNFGERGLLLFFGGLGAYLGRMDSIRLGDRLRSARYGVALVALLALVRQASNVTLTTIILGLVAIQVVLVIHKTLGLSRTSKLALSR